MKYKRVLLKLSGEQFAGSGGSGIDSDFINNLADELKELIKETGVQLAIVMGGGNFVRGKDMKVTGLKEETAHYMGMLSIVINGLALRDVLVSHDQSVQLQSNLVVEGHTDRFDAAEAIGHLEKGDLLLVVGGLGKPFLTSDTAATSTAADLKCDVVLKATKVDGVYDKDPVKYPDAKKIERMSYDEAYDNPEVAVMDKTAIDIARKNNLPIIVLSLTPRGNIKKAISGKKIGSIISA